MPDETRPINDCDLTSPSPSSVLAFSFPFSVSLLYGFNAVTVTLFPQINGCHAPLDHRFGAGLLADVMAVGLRDRAKRGLCTPYTYDSPTHTEYSPSTTVPGSGQCRAYNY